MRILSLDLGDKTGWALFDDGVIVHGLWEHHRSALARFEGGGIRFLRFLHNLRDVGALDRVVFEEVRAHRRPKQKSDNVTAAQVYGGYLATLSQFCETEKLPYEGISVGTIKKWAVGKGNASKDEVIKRANQILEPESVSISDDNEADAFVLLLLVMDAVGLEHPYLSR